MSKNATPNISSLSLASTESHCCWYCGRGENALPTKLQKCTRCGLAVYCNRECQRGDWKLHKVKCKRLTEIIVDTDVKNRLRSGALKRRLLTLSEGTVILSIRDPDITTIGDMNLAYERLPEAPFFKCKSLLHVDLKGCTKLTSVGDGAFCGCSSMTSVVLPDSLTQLSNNAFFRCSSLVSVVLPDSLTQLGNWVFNGCTSLTSVVMPDSAELGDEVFFYCDALLQKAALAGFDSVELYLRDRYISITLRKLVLRLLRKYNQAVNNADGTEVDKHATALALFPAHNSGSLEVGLFLQKMNVSGGDGVIGLVGYILEFV